MKISIVLPVHNEEENLIPLTEEILEVLNSHEIPYEIIFVDDGSTDRSKEIIRELSTKNDNIRAVIFRRNFGQTAAMAAGIDHATGEVIFLMDSDRQNDPHDIPKMLGEIKNGNDVVVGWRKDRQDAAVSRKLPSRIANHLIRKVGGVHVHDLGCSLKAFKRELIKEVHLYGEMHRFIPLYTNAIGARMAEMVVNHRPRVAGQTKYGISRTFRVILDLITVKFLLSYTTRPMYFFGKVSFGLFISCFITSIFLVIHKFANDISIIQSPLLILSAVLFILGGNFLLMGLLAELQMRTYYEAQNKPSYYVRERVNLQCAE